MGISTGKVAFLSVVGVVLCGVAGASASIIVAVVPVHDSGNAANPATGFGSVAYNYGIGEYDVTAGQYTAFLNAVAAADPYSLYDIPMATSSNAGGCGITQSGSPGNYSYATTLDPNYPVNFVNWGDAARFCNWLTNGQPSAAEGNGTTETGSYTLNGVTDNTSLNLVVRNANAKYVIPTEDEWYKAAYYDPSSGSYYLYATQSNDAPSNLLSATGTNNANYHISSSDPGPGGLTAVGTFAGSPGPYGTYDQDGDVYQWNEAVSPPFSVGTFNFPGGRGIRGGDFNSNDVLLQSNSGSSTDASGGFYGYGFRIAEVPEPAAIGVLGIGVLALLRRRR
jgi:sulfatase modifying factor 1